MSKGAWRIRGLSEYIVKLADLAEAEGRALRAGSVRVAISLSLALGGALVLCGGIALLGWGVFELLRPALGTGGAALLCGVVLAGAGAGLLWRAGKAAR